MRAVIDTNILVSSLLSKKGTPSRIFNLTASGVITPFYDSRIYREYEDVLSRPKFHFTEYEIKETLKAITQKGFLVKVPCLKIPFTDESDKKFYEAAKFCEAILITGNIRHYPKDKLVMTANEFLEKYNL